MKSKGFITLMLESLAHFLMKRSSVVIKYEQFAANAQAK